MITTHNAGGRCPCCGADNAACGAPTSTTPVDILSSRERTVGPVRKYKVTVNDIETVMKLNDQDAARYPDAVPVDSDAAPSTEEETPESPAGPKRRRRPANKARTAADKGGD